MILNGFDSFTNDVSLFSYDEEYNNNALKEQYLNWLNDVDVVQTIVSPELMQKKDMDYIEKSFHRFMQEKTKGFFIKYFSSPANGIFVGTVKIDKINDVNKSGEFGIMIGEKEFWGRNIGEKACRILIKYAFDELKLNRIWGGTDENNIAMQRIFTKCGFQIEGRIRQVIFNNGKYSDNIQFSLLKSDLEQ